MTLFSVNIWKIFFTTKGKKPRYFSFKNDSLHPAVSVCSSGWILWQI